MDSLIYSIKTEDFYSDISLDVESRFNTSGYPSDGSRPLPIGKNKKSNWINEGRTRW